MRNLTLLFIVFVYVVALNYSAVINATLIDINGVESHLYYDLDAQGYGDGFSTYDLKLQVCGDSLADVQNKYVQIVYHVGDPTDDFYNIGNSPSANYTQLSECAGTCCNTSITFDINPNYARLSGFPYAIISDDSNFDSSDEFVLITQQLKGGYIVLCNDLFSTVCGEYASNYVCDGSEFVDFGGINGDVAGGNVEVPYIRCYHEPIERGYNTTIGGLELTVKPAEGIFYVYSPNNNIIYKNANLYVGVCENTSNNYYWDCYDRGVEFYSGQASVSLNPGIIPPDDSFIHYSYLVINGLGCRFCIGPNPAMDNVTSESYRDDVENVGGLFIFNRYFKGVVNRDLNLTIGLKNDGNYKISNSFTVQVNVSDSTFTQVYSHDYIYGDGLEIYNSTDFLITIPGSVLSAVDVYSVNIAIVPGGIGDCYEEDNVFSVEGYDGTSLKINVTEDHTPHVYVKVDDVDTLNFTRACKPYNFSVYINDSNGNALEDIGIAVVEVNGINMFAPVQKIDESAGLGLKSKEIGTTKTLSNGYANFTIIPTGNEFYTTYNYLGYDAYVGNYTLYIYLYNTTTNETIDFYYGSTLRDRLYLNLESLTCETPEASEENTFSAAFHDEFRQMVQLMYNVFSSVYRWIV